MKNLKPSDTSKKESKEYQQASDNNISKSLEEDKFEAHLKNIINLWAHPDDREYLVKDLEKVLKEIIWDKYKLHEECEQVKSEMCEYCSTAQSHNNLRKKIIIIAKKYGVKL